MCFIFNRQARLLKEENTHLKARIEELVKRAYKAEAQRDKVIAECEKEIREQIDLNSRLRNIVAGRDNTINQLKAELAKYKPYRAKNGRFQRKPMTDEVR